MYEVDLKLRRTHFVDHRIDIEANQLTIIINVIDNVLIFVHRLQSIRLAGRFRTSAGSRRRH